MASVHAIIPAAGSGQRMGAAGGPKQYQALLGRPLLAWTLERLLAHPAVDGVTVVLAPDDDQFQRMDITGPVDAVTGGATRAHSVLNGVRHASAQHAADWVLVHDAARPCLDRAALDRLLQAGLASDQGAILAMPVADTLKRGVAGDPPKIRETVDREGLWAAQTPQLFPTGSLLAALEASLARGDAPTDEAGAMEAAGHHPRLVRGSASNFKVTWPGDLALAEMLLHATRKAEAS